MEAMRMSKVSEGARGIKRFGVRKRVSAKAFSVRAKRNQRGQKAVPACVRALHGVVRGRGS